MTPVRKVNRRSFLKVGIGGAAGLTIGFAVPESARLLAQTPGSRVFPLTGYVHIGVDDTVTLMLPKSEMGQGPMTAVSQMLAESWSATGRGCGRNSPRSIPNSTALCKGPSGA